MYNRQVTSNGQNVRRDQVDQNLEPEVAVTPSETAEFEVGEARTSPTQPEEDLPGKPVPSHPMNGTCNGACIGPFIGDKYNDDFVEGSPWARKTVLSLDGGGVRGYASLIVLKALMNKIKNLETTHSDELGPPVISSWEYSWQEEGHVPDNRFYLRHYFDYIAGTSTGGLSAIMLGRLKMTIDEALGQYENFGNSVFGHPRWFHERSWFFLPRSKYGSKGLKIAILGVVRSGLHLEQVENYRIRTEKFASSEHECRTMVVTFKKDEKAGVDQHYLYRSYAHLDSTDNSHLVMNPGPACQEPIWHAALATSAAHTYFDPFRIEHDTFLDGANGANNPSMMALKEVCQLHHFPPSILISIGTGEKPERPSRNARKEQLGDIKKHSRRLFIKRYIEWGTDGKNLLTHTTPIAGDAETLSRAVGTDYARFQIPSTARVNRECLGAIPLDQWLPPKTGETTITKITQLVHKYLEDDGVQQHLDDYAYKLVALRRRRAETDRWERFATDVEYHCKLSGPCMGATRPKNRPTFRRHVKENHKDCFRESSELERVLSDYRTTARATATRVNTQRTNPRRNTDHR